MEVSNTKSNFAKAMADAIRSGNAEEFSTAFEDYSNEIAKGIKEEYETLKNEKDANILAQRGYRNLTSKEENFYNKWIEGAKSSNPKQAFTDLIEIEGMPETIIEDVFDELVDEHPLLSKIDFMYVKYLTQWLLNDQDSTNYAWGELDAETVAEITGAFKNVKLEQAQLSAFLVIGVGMLELGPKFLDSYVRKILKEAIATGLEYGILYGTGINSPIGLTKDISEGVSYSTETGYPDKTAISVTDFTPASYGSIVSNLAKSEKGKKRNISGLTLVCNSVDYLTKIMPATTVLNNAGQYVNNLFPIPTEVVPSEVVADNTAILFIPKYYFCGVGNDKNGVITYSDEYKFLENMRTYKTMLYATGKAKDNNVAIVLDITNLEAAYLNVKLVDSTVETA